MDKTILKILFGWKGSLTSREFRAGLSILFLSLGSTLALYVGNSILFSFGSNMNYVDMGKHFILNSILQNFIPSLLPLSFILSYSSFAVAVKRMRSLTSSKTTSILAGILSFVFFASFSSLYAVSTRLTEIDRQQLGSWTVLHMLIYVLLGLILLGGVLFVMIGRRKQDEKADSTFTKFDGTKYALWIGNLTGVSLGLAFLLVLWILIFKEVALMVIAYNMSMFYVFVGIPHLILFCIFVRCAVNRLKDAGRPIGWAVGFIGGFIAITGIMLWGLYGEWGGIGLHFTYLLCLNAYLVGIYVLLLLPSAKVKE